MCRADVKPKTLEMVTSIEEAHDFLDKVVLMRQSSASLMDAGLAMQKSFSAAARLEKSFQHVGAYVILVAVGLGAVAAAAWILYGQRKDEAAPTRYSASPYITAPGERVG